MEMKKQRQTNIELLRILAMLMVIMLHYLGKGGYLEPDVLKKQPIYLLMETLSIVAVNVYVLISGYFMIHNEFSIKKLIRLWAQILFYSLLVPLVMSAFGFISFSEKTLYDILFYVFPVFMEHYWFATTYMLLFIMSPLLNKGIKSLNKQQHKRLLLLFVVIFSVAKSILPVHLTFDKAGYDIFWFITLYLTASYFRLYGVSFLTTKFRSLILYFSMSICSIGVILLLYFVRTRFGILEDRATMTWNYNHIFVYLASIGLFTLFLQMKNIGGKAGVIITAISSTTFGIYLLHEHVELRYLWVEIGTMGTVLLVFLAGMIIDFIRQGLFFVIEKKILKGGPHEQKK